jgi:hypothetical protein
MTLEGGESGFVLVDVLDRVLDKGIVIDAAVRVSVVGIELLGVDARVVVASIETYLLHADTLAYTDLAAAPRRDAAPAAASPPPPEVLYAEEAAPDAADHTPDRSIAPATPPMLDPPAGGDRLAAGDASEPIEEG